MQQLQTLLQTLEFGLNAPQPEAVQSALEALAALAKFDWQKKSSGQPGLAASPGEHYIEAQKLNTNDGFGPDKVWPKTIRLTCTAKAMCMCWHIHGPHDTLCTFAGWQRLQPQIAWSVRT